MHPFNVPITSYFGKIEKGVVDYVAMCKSIHEPVTITDALETSYV